MSHYNPSKISSHVAKRFIVMQPMERAPHSQQGASISLYDARVLHVLTRGSSGTWNPSLAGALNKLHWKGQWLLKTVQANQILSLHTRPRIGWNTLPLCHPCHLTLYPWSAEAMVFSHHLEGVASGLSLKAWVFRLISNFGVLTDHQACQPYVFICCTFICWYTLYNREDFRPTIP